MTQLWQDRAGRVSALRIVALAGMLAPLFWLMAQPWLASDPLDEVISISGTVTLRLLVITLAVTPFGRISGRGRVFDVRRMLGVGAALWGALHLAFYCADQAWNLATILDEIWKRFYLTLGVVALLGMGLLAITSTDGWVRRLKRNWYRLHWLMYPIVPLGLWHAALQGKATPDEAVLLTGVTLFLFLWRLLPDAPRRRLVWMLPLALLMWPLATGIEYLWFANATRLPAARIFAANWDWALAPRPAAQVGLVLLTGLIAAGLVRRPGRA